MKPTTEPQDGSTGVVWIKESPMGACDPVIKALLEKLPPKDEHWPEERQKVWLDAMSAAFAVVYVQTRDTARSRSEIVHDESGSKLILAKKSESP